MCEDPASEGRAAEGRAPLPPATEARAPEGRAPEPSGNDGREHAGNDGRKHPGNERGDDVPTPAAEASASEDQAFKALASEAQVSAGPASKGRAAVGRAPEPPATEARAPEGRDSEPSGNDGRKHAGNDGRKHPGDDGRKQRQVPKAAFGRFLAFAAEVATADEDCPRGHVKFAKEITLLMKCNSYLPSVMYRESLVHYSGGPRLRPIEFPGRHHFEIVDSCCGSDLEKVDVAVGGWGLLREGERRCPQPHKVDFAPPPRPGTLSWSARIPGGKWSCDYRGLSCEPDPTLQGAVFFLSLMVIFLPTVFIWALNGLVLGPGPGLRPQDPTGPVHPPPPFPLPPVSPTTLQLGPKSAPNRHIIEPTFAHNWFNIRLTLSQIGSKLSQIARLSGPIDRRGWQEGVIEGGDKVRANRAPTIPCAPVQ